MAELTRWQIVDLINRPGKLWLVGFDLSGMNLSRANLTGAEMEGANLTGANLSRAVLDGANLEGAILSKAVLGGASLVRVNLMGAKLIRTDLTGAKLEGANLFRADLSDAKLIGANLYNANLRQANLSTTNLTDANLRGAVMPEGNIGLSTTSQRVNAGKYFKIRFGKHTAFTQVLRYNLPVLFQYTNRKTLKVVLLEKIYGYSCAWKKNSRRLDSRRTASFVGGKTPFLSPGSARTFPQNGTDRDTRDRH
jgi:hypothetical protein